MRCILAVGWMVKYAGRMLAEGLKRVIICWRKVIRTRGEGGSYLFDAVVGERMSRNLSLNLELEIIFGGAVFWNGLGSGARLD
jgi:hypothetical protein